MERVLPLRLRHEDRVEKHCPTLVLRTPMEYVRILHPHFGVANCCSGRHIGGAALQVHEKLVDKPSLLWSNGATQPQLSFTVAPSQTLSDTSVSVSIFRNKTTDPFLIIGFWGF